MISSTRDCLHGGDLRAIFTSEADLPALAPVGNDSSFSVSIAPNLGCGLLRGMNKLVMENLKCTCPMMCTVTENSTQFCPQVGNQAITFWAYFGLRIIAALFMGAAFSLLDATALSIVTKQGKEYGKQRIWAILAMAILSPITGILVDIISRSKGTNNGQVHYHNKDATHYHSMPLSAVT
jgi:MFS family permease